MKVRLLGAAVSEAAVPLLHAVLLRRLRPDDREFFASNNKTQLFSQCTPHPRPGVIVLVSIKVRIQIEERSLLNKVSLSRLKFSANCLIFTS